MYEKYKNRDLTIIGVPSNDFGNQEFTKNEKVKEFCSVNYNIEFILTEITKIKGPEGHNFFKWVRKQQGYLAFPKWNFYKYIIDKNGNLRNWFASTTRPTSKKFISSLEKVILSSG